MRHLRAPQAGGRERRNALAITPPSPRTGSTDRFGVGTAAKAVGLLALVSSALYFVSDALETAQGGFSAGQLWLTLVAEATLPVFIVGLAVIQRPRLGPVGVFGAVAYAYTYVFFTWTVVYALVNGVEDYDALTDQLGTVMIAHGAIMVLAGFGFGLAVLRARLLPAWTAVALMAGVVLVALVQGMPEVILLSAAGLRDLAFAGMGAAVVGRARSSA